MRYILIPLLIFATYHLQAQKTIPLYPGKIPNSLAHPNNEQQKEEHNRLMISKISQPSLRIYLPENGNAAGVIIFPGGGYWVNAIAHEGYDVARRLNEAGIAAFVVKYRIPNDSTMKNKAFGPLQDAQQAISVVRAHAVEWKIDPTRIGVMGFSAGGHLASSLSTHYDTLLIENADAKILRPDFSMLIYPVITFDDSLGHRGSRDQLIGKDPEAYWINYYSNEKQITQDTPPTFLVHAADDDVVPVMNSILYFEGLQAHGVPGELHIYQEGGHGFGLINPTTEDRWMDLCLHWMKSNGWLETRK